MPHHPALTMERVAGRDSRAREQFWGSVAWAHDGFMGSQGTGH